MHVPTYVYWVIVKCIMRYFKGTIFFGLHITCTSSFSLHDFTYVDRTDSVYDHKSTGDYLVFFKHTPTSWKSGKQHVMACSSTKNEYKALADGTFEVIWIQ